MSGFELVFPPTCLFFSVVTIEPLYISSFLSPLGFKHYLWVHGWPSVVSAVNKGAVSSYLYLKKNPANYTLLKLRALSFLTARPVSLNQEHHASLCVSFRSSVGSFGFFQCGFFFKVLIMLIIFSSVNERVGIAGYQSSLLVLWL